MKTKAARLYGKNDVRVEEFELPMISDDELLVKVVSNSICMSTYKAAKLGPEHKRVPNDVNDNPVITGHEFAGEIVQVGKNWQSKYKIGDKCAIQPALYYEGKPVAPGYSFPNFGGNATYTIVPWEYIEFGCVLPYDGESFSNASLAEPFSCVVGAFKANYHTKVFVYEHFMGIKEGGNLAMMAAAGPMGLAAIDYLLHCDRRPSKLMVVDIDNERLDYARKVLPTDKAKELGIELSYVNTSEVDNPKQTLMDFTNGEGYDDVFVYAPVKQVIELSDDILGYDGCLNFFAGPMDTEFKASFNFYNVHYNATHIAGTSGGSTSDMQECLDMSAKGLVNPALMVSHVGGLEDVPNTICDLPNLSGNKKLIYPHIEMPLTDIRYLRDLDTDDKRYSVLADVLDKSNGIWSLEAEKYVLKNF